ncbi:MAG: OmpA family protein [Bacteroidales bacterium]|nr:OmpA family protein [Bacteroidales bacterium]
MKKSLLILVLLIFGFEISAYSQLKPKINKSEYVSVTDNPKIAWKNVKKGNRHYKHNKLGHYRLAAYYYNEALKYNEDNSALLYRCGVSEIKSSHNLDALKHLDNAYSTGGNAMSEDCQYWFAVAEQRNNKFELALSDFEDCTLSMSNNTLKKLSNDIELRKNQCEEGIKQTKQPEKALRKPLEGNINSEYPEYSPIFGNVDSSLYFTSRRYTPEKHKRNPVDYEFYEDIYSSAPSNGVWDEARNLGRPINKKKNDASIATSVTGNDMIVYRSKKGNGTLYFASKKNNTYGWRKPKKAIKNINDNRAKEISLSFSNDSTKLIFCSNRKKDNLGGFDIYICNKTLRGGWSKPKNIGVPINSEYDETSASFGPGDSIIYFAYNGPESIGGYDLMKSSCKNGKWQTPINLGLGVNSGDDEQYFSLIPGDERMGYYSSKMTGGKGDYDIYQIMVLNQPQRNYPSLPPLVAINATQEPFLPLEDPEAIKTMRMTIVKGVVTDWDSIKFLNAKIVITDNVTNEVIQTINTNPETGAYTVMLPSGRNYAMTVSSEGYMFHSENFNIPSTTKYQEIIKNIRLLSMDPGSKVVLNNVFFDTGKSNLRPESYGELNRLAEVFKLYPKLVIEISGHTDNVGSKAANNKLSQNRAQAVVDYLISVGVEKTHLVAKGYGPSQPRDTNKTPEGRQNNRRVEAKILSK